ncbi:MAG TPA: transketolase C-terminal domain-containing protein [Streptosporangiaceae bacterium]
MTGAVDRVGASLNQALHELLAARPRLMLLGEDIADPYGGAFGVTRGLSTRFPDRVLTTPISEAAITGLAGGLALAGDEVVIEVMFGDFATLCFDPLVNFLAKSVSMYGRPLRVPVVVRCPAGGNRGYGPTHSQSPHKHFIGVPNLSLWELSPLHPAGPALTAMLDAGTPAIFFEDKVLYTQPRFGHEPGDAIFSRTDPGGSAGWARVSTGESAGADGSASTGEAAGAGEPGADWAVIAPGGMVRRVLGAMRAALVEDEVTCDLLTPARLFPVGLDPVLPLLAGARRILIAEDGVAGGGWAAAVALEIHQRLWGRLRAPVQILQPPCEIIPAAAHLERELLVQESDIQLALTGAAGD